LILKNDPFHSSLFGLLRKLKGIYPGFRDIIWRAVRMKIDSIDH
jgi:hypothetical protein